MRWLLTCLFPIACAVQLFAQEPARASGFGRISDADGKPWPGAEVHLLHRPHDAIVDPAFGEHFVLTSDDKGEFRQPLLVGAAWRRLEAGQRSFELKIDPRHVVRFRVVDRAGKPIPNALVHPSALVWHQLNAAM